MVQRGRAERKTKEQEQEQEETRGKERETEYVVDREAHEDRGGKRWAEEAEREDKNKSKVRQVSGTVKFRMTMRIYGLVG